MQEFVESLGAQSIPDWKEMRNGVCEIWGLFTKTRFTGEREKRDMDRMSQEEIAFHL